MTSESQERETVQPSAPETEPIASADADPRELLASANEASGPARNAWLAFLALLTYLLVTLAGVTHADLLLNSPVRLPIINVEIPLFSFFLFAPFLFVLVHLGLLVQHALLAHKYQHFSAVIAESEERQARDHPDRKLVHNYVFSQVLAGSKAPFLLDLLMRLMIFVTFNLLPILLLLYFQIKFLPAHDVATTHAHRLAILLDLALLFIIWPFATPYLRPRWKRLSLSNANWHWELSYADLGLAGLLFLLVVSFNLLVATVPEGCFWPWGKHSKTSDNGCFSLDRTMARMWSVKVETQGRPQREVFAPTAWLFEGEPEQATSTAQSLFSRNLIVTDNKALVERKDFKAGETSLNLRGRDLRFAVLDRTDLHRADLFESDLRGASARNTRLDHGVLRGAQLQGANLVGATLQGANLVGATLQGAGLARAQLQGADLTYAQLQGANLVTAQLQGADIKYAQLQGADLTYAQLQGAVLVGAQLQGANLKLARLQGADLAFAQLQGANLAQAQLQGANLGSAKVWQTVPPSASELNLAVLMALNNNAPLDPEAKSQLEKLIAEAEGEGLKYQLQHRLGPLLISTAAPAWEGSRDHQSWLEFASRPTPNPAQLSNYLTELACRNGYVIEGIAQRIDKFSRRDYGRAYTKVAAAKLVNEETCPAARHLSEKTRARLKEIAATEKKEAEP